MYTIIKRIVCCYRSSEEQSAYKRNRLRKILGDATSLKEGGDTSEKLEEIFEQCWKEVNTMSIYDGTLHTPSKKVSHSCVHQLLWEMVVAELKTNPDWDMMTITEESEEIA